MEASGEVPEGGASETDFVSLLEVDAAGRVVALVAFDPEDRAVASREMSERFLRDGAGARDATHRLDEVPPNAASRTLDVVARLFETRDWNALRALASAEFRFEDRRAAVRERRGSRRAAGSPRGLRHR